MLTAEEGVAKIPQGTCGITSQVYRDVSVCLFSLSLLVFFLALLPTRTLFNQIVGRVHFVARLAALLPQLIGAYHCHIEKVIHALRVEGGVGLDRIG